MSKNSDLLDMAELIHSWSHARCGCLHKTNTVQLRLQHGRQIWGASVFEGCWGGLIRFFFKDEVSGRLPMLVMVLYLCKHGPHWTHCVTEKRKGYEVVGKHVDEGSGRSEGWA